MVLFFLLLIFIIQFDTKFEMPETRSGKFRASEGVENAQESSLEDIITEKLNGFKDELLTEIKLLVKSEVDEALKKQKEEFDSAFTQLEKRITTLENERDPSV